MRATPKYPVPYAVLRALSVLMPNLTRSHEPIERIKTVKCLDRLLLVYGTRDRATPPEMGERLLAACRLPESQRELWVVPEAKHLGTLATAADTYRQRVLSFLDSATSTARN